LHHYVNYNRIITRASCNSVHSSFYFIQKALVVYSFVSVFPLVTFKTQFYLVLL